MIQGQRVLAIIPARGGSKGIKDKNIRTLHGKPLIAYTIEAAKCSQYVDTVLVTTDSVEIADVAREYGAYVPFLRPAELASDTAKTIDAVMHAVTWVKEHMDHQGQRDSEGVLRDYNILVLLQPTSPLRTAEDIDGALEWYEKKGAIPLASVSQVEQHPILMRSIEENGTVRKLLSCQSTIRRQDMSAYYYVNGSIYINQIQDLTYETSFNDNPLAYIIPPEHSIDIDNEKDLILAEYYLQLGKD